MECLNLNHSDILPFDIIQSKIATENFDVVCTGGLSVFYSNIKEVIDAAKQIKANIITIVGGGLLSSEPELIMSSLGATFGVIGEGEETITELAYKLSNSQQFDEVRCYVPDSLTPGVLI